MFSLLSWGHYWIKEVQGAFLQWMKIYMHIGGCAREVCTSTWRRTYSRSHLQWPFNLKPYHVPSNSNCLCGFVSFLTHPKHSYVFLKQGKNHLPCLKPQSPRVKEMGLVMVTLEINTACKWIKKLLLSLEDGWNRHLLFSFCWCIVKSFCCNTVR